MPYGRLIQVSVTSAKTSCFHSEAYSASNATFHCGHLALFIAWSSVFGSDSRFESKDSVRWTLGCLGWGLVGALVAVLLAGKVNPVPGIALQMIRSSVEKPSGV